MRIVTAIVVSATFLMPFTFRAQNAGNCAAEGNVQYVCGQEAPEDLVSIPNSDWVLASSYGGTGGIRLISVSSRTSNGAYPSATAKDRFDKKTYDTCPGPPE